MTWKDQTPVTKFLPVLIDGWRFFLRNNTTLWLGQLVLNYTCPRCGKTDAMSFNSEDAMRDEIGKINFECDKCEFTFQSWFPYFDGGIHEDSRVYLRGFREEST